MRVRGTVSYNVSRVIRHKPVRIAIRVRSPTPKTTTTAIPLTLHSTGTELDVAELTVEVVSSSVVAGTHVSVVTGTGLDAAEIHLLTIQTKTTHPTHSPINTIVNRVHCVVTLNCLLTIMWVVSKTVLGTYWVEIFGNPCHSIGGHNVSRLHMVIVLHRDFHIVIAKTMENTVI